MWIDLDGLANMRDVGGIPTTDGGKIIPGRLLRSDNLQTLTNSDVDQLLGLGLTDVIDLRSDYEAVQEGPTPLATSEVRTQRFSLFREWEFGVGETKPDGRPEVMPEEALPWVDLEPSVELDNDVASVYFSYLVDRPDSILAALRTIAQAPGVALVHCAAGKDRTGTLVALALSLADAERQAIIDDYTASSERVEEIVGRLMSSTTYVDNLRGRPMSSHLSQPGDHDQLSAAHRQDVRQCAADVAQDGLDHRGQRAATRQAARLSLIALLAALAPRGSRFVAAYFVVARRRKACPLTPPQHGGARSGLRSACDRSDEPSRAWTTRSLGPVEVVHGRGRQSKLDRNLLSDPRRPFLAR